MRVLLAVAIVGAVASGCAAPGEIPCGSEHRASLRTPWVDGGYLRTAPSATWDTVVLQTGPGADPLAQAGPRGWHVAAERLSGPGATNFSVLRVSPGDGEGRLGLDYALAGCERKSGTITWDLEEPREGRAAGPGQGVHVMTAGFLTNGTLFYTNIRQLDHGDWPRTPWYAWEGGEPLPVYVYDEDRSEQPAAWKDPQAGTPLEGTVAGLGYFTTIPGFNEALKGLPTTTVRVVRMAAEDGYTRPGNEEHPLYGEALVFYIKVLDVVDLPCPMGVARLCGAVGTMGAPDGQGPA